MPSTDMAMPTMRSSVPIAGVRIAAVPVTVRPGIMVPRPMGAAPASPGMPTTVIPEPWPAAPPAVVVRAVDPAATDEYGARISRVAAIAAVVIVVGVAGAGRIVAGAVKTGHPDANADGDTGLRGRSGRKGRATGDTGRSERACEKLLHSRHCSNSSFSAPLRGYARECARGRLNTE